jgi:hypothetical protein
LPIGSPCGVQPLPRHRGLPCAQAWPHGIHVTHFAASRVAAPASTGHAPSLAHPTTSRNAQPKTVVEKALVSLAVFYIGLVVLLPFVNVFYQVPALVPVAGYNIIELNRIRRWS